MKKGLLLFHASRPTLFGLEMHLVVIYKLVKEFKPKTIVLDPITNLITVGDLSQVKSILIRLIDFLQKEQITVMFTALSLTNEPSGQTDEGVSSLVDAWVLVRDIEFNGERNRGLYIMKSRGIKNSNKVREFVITDKGIKLVDVFATSAGVLTGSARQAYQEAQDRDLALKLHAKSRTDQEVARKKAILGSKIEELKSNFESMKAELEKIFLEDELRTGLKSKKQNGV